MTLAIALLTIKHTKKPVSVDYNEEQLYFHSIPFFKYGRFGAQTSHSEKNLSLDSNLHLYKEHS